MATLPESSNLQPEKRQRLSRACDTCRRRKVKCDQDAVPGVRCQRCTVASVTCTWDDEVKKRGRKRRVDALEARLQALEEVLSQKTAALASAALEDAIPDPIPSTSASSPSDGVEIEDEDDPEIQPLIERVSRLEIGAMDSGVFTLSTSTGRRLARTVHRLRADLGPDTSVWEPDPWELEESMRWKMMPRKQFSFPPEDLIDVLVDAYFLHFNLYMPLLHVHIFWDAVAKHLHYSDRDFAAVLLLVCAIGSRYVDDPRVLLPGQPKRSAGWMWYTQCDITRQDVLHPPTLYQIQAYLLATYYLGGIFNARVAWMLPNMALRSMQEMGVHRKGVYSAKPNVKDEQWKRCFWIAAGMDVSVASETGRPCFLVDGSFDVDLPAECDDEFWSPADPSQAFKQPADRPAAALAFVHHCKLKLLHVKAMRTLFSAQAESEPRQDALRDIESALSEWLENIPSHLNWNRQRNINDFGEPYIRLAVRLRLEYRYFQLIIHRPFVSVRNLTPESANAFAICTSAARAICDIFRTIHRQQPPVVSNLMLYANGVCLVLLLALWGAREMNMQVDTEGISNDIQECLSTLKQAAPFFRHAEGMYRRLSRYASKENVSLPVLHLSHQRPSEDNESSMSSFWNNSQSFATDQPSPSNMQPSQMPILSETIFPPNDPPLSNSMWGEPNLQGTLHENALYEWNQFAGHPLALSDTSGTPGTTDLGNDLLWEWSRVGHPLDPTYGSGATFQDQ